MDELNNKGKTEHAVNVIKRIIKKLLGKERGANITATPAEKGESDQEEE